MLRWLREIYHLCLFLVTVSKINSISIFNNKIKRKYLIILHWNAVILQFTPPHYFVCLNQLIYVFLISDTSYSYQFNKITISYISIGNTNDLRISIIEIFIYNPYKVQRNWKILLNHTKLFLNYFLLHPSLISAFLVPDNLLTTPIVP